MVIGRKPSSEGKGQIAMMILKLDAAPPRQLLEALRNAEGILGATAVELR